MDGTVGLPSPAGAVRPLARRAISTALIHWLSPRSTCDPDPAHEDVNLCEKPVGNSYITLAVCTSLAGTIAGTTIIMLLWLHFRRMARDRREYDPFELADYGIVEEDLSAEKRLMKKRAALGTKAFHIHVQKSSISRPRPMTPSRDSLHESVHSFERPLRPGVDPFASPYAEDSPGYMREGLSPEPLIARNLTSSPQPMMAESPLARLELPSQKRKPVPISK